MKSESKTAEMLKNATLKQGLYAINFMPYIDLIKEKYMGKFIREVLIDHSPDYFWTMPASTSGKYHNEDECVEGGLLIHTKRVINMSIKLMEGIGWYDHRCKGVKVEKQEGHDIVIAAAILHDLFKAGYVGRENKKGDKLYTDSMHPYYVRDALRMKKTAITGEEIFMYKLPFFDKIMRAIECHYGYWSVMPYTANLENAQSPEFILYMADYIASRKLDMWFKV
jgi:HD superfamily phosphohydrolase YqeK